MICTIEEFNAISPHLKRPLIIDSTNNDMITCHLATNDEMCRIKTESIKKMKKHPFHLTLQDVETGFDWLKQEDISLPKLIKELSGRQIVNIVKTHRSITGAGLGESKQLYDRNIDNWKNECDRFIEVANDMGVTVERAIRIMLADNDDDDNVINKFTLIS